MKLLNLYVYSTMFQLVRSSIMPTKKICKDCRHFIWDNIECRKFGDTNLITGKVTYKYARSVREDETLCGEDAILFEENQYKIITVPYYFLKEKLVIFIPGLLFGLYASVLFYILHK
jgi:hypothetical protein